MAKPRTILVVDDDPTILKFFKDFFQKEGYTHMITKDPEKAVRLAEQVQPDLLVIDIRMPKIDGFGVINRVREKTAHVKVIVVSGYIDDEMPRIKEARVDGFLSKPPDFAKLDQMILDVIGLTKAEVLEKVPPEGRPEVNVLFVDDETEITDFLGEALNQYGFPTDIANSGEEALEKAKKKRYDILITDVSMRKMSGIDTVRRIQEECAEKPACIAVASANVISEVKEQFAGLNVDEFFSKPVNLEELIQWLETRASELVAKRNKNQG